MITGELDGGLTEGATEDDREVGTNVADELDEGLTEGATEGESEVDTGELDEALTEGDLEKVGNSDGVAEGSLEGR